MLVDFLLGWNTISSCDSCEQEKMKSFLHFLIRIIKKNNCVIAEIFVFYRKTIEFNL